MTFEQFLEYIGRPMIWPVNVRRVFLSTLPISLPALVLVNLAVYCGLLALCAVLWTVNVFGEWAKRMWSNGE